MSAPDDDALDPLDDFTLVPYDRQPILGPVTHTITINMVFDNDDYGINRLVPPTKFPGSKIDSVQGDYQ